MNENEILTVLFQDAFRELAIDFLKYPEDLEITVTYAPNELGKQQKLLIDARCNYADQGRLIGKDRKNFLAISTIMFLIAERYGVQIRVNNILLPTKGKHEPSQIMPEWDKKAYEKKLEAILNLFLVKDFLLNYEFKNSELIFIFEVDRNEQLPLAVGQVAYELSKIMHAIGRARGQIVKVNGCEEAA